MDINGWLKEQMVSAEAYDADALIDRFLDAAWAERGLSRNTLKSYRYDLLQLDARLGQSNKTLSGAGRADLLTFLAAEVDGWAISAQCCWTTRCRWRSCSRSR